MLAGWIPALPDPFAGPLIAVTLALLFGGGAVWLILEAWASFRRRLPSGSDRDRVAVEASRLGLRSLERDASALDLSFPFLRGKGPAYFTSNFNRWVGGLTHPTYDWIFAGAWKGRDVRIFDYSFSSGDDREEWTCVQVPVDVGGAQIEITRAGLLSGLKKRFGRTDVEVGDEQFDAAFHVVAADSDPARRLLTADMRAKLLELAPFPFMLQLNGDRMLCCSMRLPIEDRTAVMDLATRLADALSSQAGSLR